MPEINILHTKNTINLINEKYGFDAGIFSTPVFRYKIDTFMEMNKIRDPELFIKKLGYDKDFFSGFLSHLLFTDTEIFRDPEMWIYLKNEVIPYLTGFFGNIRMKISLCSSGSELYSSQILISESEIGEKSSVYYDWTTKEHYNNITTGSFDNNIMESSLENIQKVFPGCDPKKYFSTKDKGYIFNPDFLKKLKSNRFRFDLPEEIQKYNLIICRNRMLSFSLDYQNLLMEHLVKSLENDGVIVIGFKENIKDFLRKNNQLMPLNHEESIYKKTGS